MTVNQTTRATGKTSTETLEYAAIIIGLLLKRPSAEIRKRLEAGETIATEHCDWTLAVKSVKEPPPVKEAAAMQQFGLFG